MFSFLFPLSRSEFMKVNSCIQNIPYYIIMSRICQEILFVAKKYLKIFFKESGTPRGYNGRPGDIFFLSKGRAQYDRNPRRTLRK